MAPFGTHAIALALLVLGSAVAGRAPAADLDLAVGVFLGGYRNDDIELRDANAFGGTRKIEFRNAEMNLIEVVAEGLVGGRFAFRGEAAFAWVYDGALDFTDDGDDGPFDPGTGLGDRDLRIVGAPDEDRALGFSGGVGYRFAPLGERVRIVPMAGFSHHRIDVEARSPRRVLLDGSPDATPFGRVRLDSTLEGPWVGVDLALDVTDRIELMGIFEHHWTDYTGELRIAGARSRIEGDGTGLRWGGSARIRFLDWLMGELRYRGQSRSVDVDAARPSDLSWDSYSVSGGVLISF